MPDTIIHTDKLHAQDTRGTR